MRVHKRCAIKFITNSESSPKRRQNVDPPSSLCKAALWPCPVLRALRCSFVQKWNKFKYIFSAFRIKQKDASLCCLPPAGQLLGARLLSLGLDAVSFIFRPFAVSALPAPFIVVVLSQQPSSSDSAFVSVYLFTFALYYSPLTWQNEQSSRLGNL